MAKSMHVRLTAFITVILLSFTLTFSQFDVHFEPFYDLQSVNFKADEVIQIWMGEVPGLTQHFWVLGQEATLWSLYPDGNGDYEKQQLFDIGNRVPLVLGSEYGSYDVAFHPDFINNKKFYLLTMVYRDLNNTSWSASDLVLEEWTASGDRYQDVTFARELLRVPHARESFGTSSMIFGPDGYLYLSVSDYYKNGWDMSDLARKVLRIDIDNTEGDLEYAIPSDNPYVNDPSDTVRTEIWASGFRNGWSMSFSPDGDLWLGDVGQWQDEEINLVLPGLNYGWRDGGDAWPQVIEAYEAEWGISWANQSRGFSGFCADRDYNPTVFSNINCDDFQDPTWRFKNRVGVSFTVDCVIVGPVVNGDPSDPLYGMLLFADNTGSKIYAVDPNDVKDSDNDPSEGPMQIADLGELGTQTHNGIVSFTEDGYGNIYVVLNSWDANIKHELYRLTGLIPRDTLLPVSTAPAPGTPVQAKSELIFTQVGSRLSVPDNMSTLKMYTLKGELSWQTNVQGLKSVAIPQNIPGSVYRVVYR